jgi:SIR2-like domain
MPHYLLTGAGFSRNWGGWLASEAFEYLLGAPEIDDYLRNTLWAAKLRGEGFEGALSIVQAAYTSDKSVENKDRLDKLTRAVIGMFTAMQAAFNKLDYRNSDLRLQQFLSKFDAIFTLNQDTLLETLYAGDVRWSERWYGSYLPYIKFIEEPPQPYPFVLREPLTQDTECIARENYQPIYKLHGSYNWFAEPKGERLLVMGGNKTSSIKAFQVLKRYQEEFLNTLSLPDSHLMVIGYSFCDPHINNAIQAGAIKGLKLFIIDTLGVDVIDRRNTRAQIPEPVTDLMHALMPRIIGASRRSLIEIINTDPVENEKVMRFFQGQPHIIRIAPQSISQQG